MDLERTVTGLVALVGVVALALAVVVASVPVELDPVMAALGPVLAKPGLVALSAVVLGGVVGYRALRGSHAAAPDRAAVGTPTPPSARERDRDAADAVLAGDYVDERLSTVSEGDEAKTRIDMAVTKKKVTKRIDEVAVEVLADANGWPRERAREAVDAGEWTDRPRARVLLGEDVQGLSLSTRIRDWASGEAFERQVRAAVVELADVADVAVDDSLEPLRAEDPETVREDAAASLDRAVADLRETADLDDDGVDGLYRPDVFSEDGSLDDLDLDGPAPVATESSAPTEAGTSPTAAADHDSETDAEPPDADPTDPEVETADAGGESR